MAHPLGPDFTLLYLLLGPAALDEYDCRTVFAIDPPICQPTVHLIQQGKGGVGKTVVHCRIPEIVNASCVVRRNRRNALVERLVQEDALCVVALKALYPANA